MAELQKVKLPIPLGELFTLQTRLIRYLRRRAAEGPVTAESFVEFNNLLRMYGLDRASPDALSVSTQDVIGQRLGEEQILLLGRRLSGGYHHLCAGRAVPAWHVQPDDEWAAVQVLEVEKVRSSKKKKLGANLKFRILTGYGSGLTVTKFWPMPVSRYLSTQIFGFSKPWLARPYRDPLELCRLFAVVFIEKARSLTAPSFYHVGYQSSLVNKNIARLKARADKNKPGTSFPCPAGWSYPCIRCPLGYLDGEAADDLRGCPCATHPVHYQLAACPTCERTTYFDPSKPRRGQCVDCSTKERVRLRKD